MPLRDRVLAGLSTAVAVAALSAVPVQAASHLWVISEVFSNADGTIQFVEMWSPAPNETNLAGRVVHTTLHTSNPFTANLPPNSTADKYLLVATAAFAALPGAPTPDLLIPPNFLDTGGDTVQWDIYPASVLSFGTGVLPTDGVHSYYRTGATGLATPTNFPGATFAPPGVAALTVGKLVGFPQGSRLSLAWDDGLCLGAAKFHLVYGFGSQLPSSLGGTYGLQPAGPGQCTIPASPKTWSGVPDPALDPTRLLWFLMLAGNGGSIEGSWGTDGAGAERNGPAGGASGQCAMTTKSLSNACP